MRTEIVINVGIHETRIAILEDGQVMEILVERPEHERMVGNIYKGVVRSVMPGMQAAFVDIGSQKNAFLHVSDVADVAVDYELEEEGERKRPAIQDLLHKGQEVLIQITKEPIDTKGPRATAEIALPGRFLVLLPNDNRIGVSRKIKDWSEKDRLRRVAREVKPENFGVIVRTVAKGKGKDEFESDIKNLLKTWRRIEKKGQRVKAPALIHREMGMTFSLIRDLFTDEVDRVVIDSKKECKQILSYLKSVAPHLCSRVELYAEKTPIFDAFQIEGEIDKAWDRKVWLKKGAYLTIDHTEALVAIDVNSGKYAGKLTQGKTALAINIEAAREIARQLRLRDIGGIIVIDFIDMSQAADRRKVWEELVGALKRDRSKTSVLPISDLGLLEMTRQRVKPSLLYTFSEPCPLCNGVGRVQGRDTTVTKIERWLKRSQATSGERKLILRAHPLVAEYLLENKEARFKMLKKSTKTRIQLEPDPDLPIEAYRFLSWEGDVDITDKFEA